MAQKIYKIQNILDLINKFFETENQLFFSVFYQQLTKKLILIIKILYFLYYFYFFQLLFLNILSHSYQISSNKNKSKLMSSLSYAGKSAINPNVNQINRAFTKGLYGMDPSELQRKQQQKRRYQQELRLQAQQAQRRKAQQKARQKQQDQRLQKKIQKELEKQKMAKNQQKTQKEEKEKLTVNFNYNQNNKPNHQVQTNNNKKNLFNASMQNSMVKYTYGSSPQINPLKNFQGLNLQSIIKQQYQQKSLYPSGQSHLPSYLKSTYDLQQDHYLRQQKQNQLKRFKQTLDRKIQQVYKHIQSSKNSVGSSQSIIDDIRRRLKSNSYMNQQYSQLQRSNVKNFQDEFSQFYKIPKRSVNSGADKYQNYGNNNKRLMDNNNRDKDYSLKKLDYDSQSRYKSSFMAQENSYNTKRSFKNSQKSRLNAPNYQNLEYKDQVTKWGNKRNANNFLGNRQALDYQIDSVLNNMDNILQRQNNQTNY